MATAAHWRSIRNIVHRHRTRGAGVVIVCSALAGVTNTLDRLVASCRAQRDARIIIDEVATRHADLADDLGVDPALIEADFQRLRADASSEQPMTAAREARIMATGELCSTRLGHAFLENEGVACEWVDARGILRAETRVDEEANLPSAECTTTWQPSTAAGVHDAGVIVTQGYIASNDRNETVLLGRGGSDTSAAYMAAILRAERLEIWSDVPGVFTANPAEVPHARLVNRIGLDEASTLAGLGAGVIHPRCLQVAGEHEIPIQLGWTRRPVVEGTRVIGDRDPALAPGASATTSRNGLWLLILRRPYRWQPVGFLGDVARCFRAHHLSIDLVSSCASEIRATLDPAAFPSSPERVDALVRSLQKVCDVEIVPDVSSVSVVGRRLTETLPLLSSVGACFDGQAVHMVTHASNGTAISYIVDRESAASTVGRLHRALFEETAIGEDFGPSWTHLCDAAA